MSPFSVTDRPPGRLISTWVPGSRFPTASLTHPAVDRWEVRDDSRDSAAGGEHHQRQPRRPRHRFSAALACGLAAQPTARAGGLVARDPSRRSNGRGGWPPTALRRRLLAGEPHLGHEPLTDLPPLLVRQLGLAGRGPRSRARVGIPETVRSAYPPQIAAASGGDVLNAPPEAFAGRRGTLITSHVVNDPQSRPERSSGTLCTRFRPSSAHPRLRSQTIARLHDLNNVLGSYD